MTLFTFNVIKVLGSAAIASAIAAIWCPFLINFLYKHKLWKKTARIKAISGEDATVFHSLHKDREVTVPRFGGLIIWVTVVFVVFVFYWFPKLNFLSRGQTWLPLFTLISASLLGFLDDFLQIFGKGKYIGGGISLKKRFFIVILIAIIGGIWFYSKLGWDVITIPLLGQFSIGVFYIPPARFYMSETGTLGLTTVLSVVAFLTDSVFVLPIIAGLLVLETGSVIIQLLSKKFRKKKIFLSTPIHHHFEAIGWPQYKITMRAWILGIVLAIVGVAIRLL